MIDVLARIYKASARGVTVFAPVLVVGAVVVHTLISPDVYEAVDLDRREARRQARQNPNNHATRRFLGEKVMAFLDAQGMLTWYTRPTTGQCI